MTTTTATTMTMMIRNITLCSSLFFLCLFNRVVDASKPQNILLLLTDDQDVMLGCFDHMPKVRSLLQEQGMTFEHSFVHTPVCCPSRSSILTGRYLHNNGARNNSISGNCYGQSWKADMEPQHTYAVHAQKLGYSTVYMGKYLNQYGYGPADEVKVPAGWDHWLGLVGNSQYYNYSLVDGGVGRETKVQHFGDTYPEDYLPYVLKEHSLHFISTLPEPWLIVVAWPTPHAPFTPAPWAVDTMKDHHAPITANYNASDIYMQQKHWLLRQLLPMTKNTADKVDYYYRRRLEALKSVDEHVGLMVDKLDHLGRLEDTVIMYTSDNGFQFGQHRLSLDKRHLYENDIRVPFCIRGPGIPPNSQSSKIVANIDIAPTILDIIRSSSNSSASITLNAAKDSMDGSSIWKYVQGRGGNNDSFTNRHDLLITYHGEGQLPCGTATCPPVYGGILWMPDSFNNTYNCVRTYRGATDEDSIYCRFDDDENFVEFYDLNKNPYQLNNEYADLKDFERQRYEHRLNELMTCQGPTCRRRHHHVRGKEVTNS